MKTKHLILVLLVTASIYSCKQRKELSQTIAYQECLQQGKEKWECCSYNNSCSEDDLKKVELAKKMDALVEKIGGEWQFEDTLENVVSFDSVEEFEEALQKNKVVVPLNQIDKLAVGKITWLNPLDPSEYIKIIDDEMLKVNTKNIKGSFTYKTRKNNVASFFLEFQQKDRAYAIEVFPRMLKLKDNESSTIEFFPENNLIKLSKVK